MTRDQIIADSDVEFSGRMAGHVRFIRRGEVVLYEWTCPDGDVLWASFDDVEHCARAFVGCLQDHYGRLH